MMLRAIAIFKIDGSNTKQPYNRTEHYEPRNAYDTHILSTVTFWQQPDYLLKHLETSSLPQLKIDDIQTHFPIHIPSEREHHYFKKIINQPLIIALCCKNKLSKLESYYLFKNVENALLHPETSNVTLEKIMGQTLQYTNKDHLPAALLNQIEESKHVMLQNIDKMLERGENLEYLQLATLELCESSSRFKREAEKQNSYCSGYC